MDHADDQFAAGKNPGGHRQYNSFVVRLWSDPGVAGVLVRVEVRHVQTERVWKAHGVDPTDIAVAIRDLLQGTV